MRQRRRCAWNPRPARRNRPQPANRRPLLALVDAGTASKDSTSHYADILASRRRAGAPTTALDAQIASICRQYSATLVTRNVADFADTGVGLLNPWCVR
ncbi:MAG: putative nucleic acid-binding protein contains domain protein [Jatrophihabitans sp.]|nr:putative nucleic acid-binding protein contains domain protein [Jatrophihabitans sp.]